MQRASKIKYRDRDIERMKKLVKNFNAKVGRMQKNPANEGLKINKINMELLKGQIETRKDFNRVVKKYERFLRRNSEKIVITKTGEKRTAWEKKEYEIAKRVATKKITKKLKKLNASEYTGTKQLVKDLGLDVKFRGFGEIEDIDAAIRRVEKRLKQNYDYEQMVRYRENYIQAVARSGIPYADVIGQIVRGISPENFTLLYYEEPMLEIDYIYDPVEAEQKAENIIEKLEYWVKNGIYS